MSEKDIEIIKAKKGFIIDMDGVLYHGNRLLPGVVEFVNWLKVEDKKFLFLTNASGRSPRELKEKLIRLGIDVKEERFYTSGLATANFLANQKPGGSAYVIGKPNPFIMRHAIKSIACHSEESIIIGDRMDTDIIAGVESGIDTLLVLSGITNKNELHNYSYQPKFILEGVADLVN